MPVPKTIDVGKIMKFLNEESPSMPRKQKIAIALERARAAGARIPKKDKKKSKKRS